jgi:hypothetical protein
MGPFLVKDLNPFVTNTAISGDTNNHDVAFTTANASGRRLNVMRQTSIGKQTVLYRQQTVF